jgi:hypothetical protein
MVYQIQLPMSLKNRLIEHIKKTTFIDEDILNIKVEIDHVISTLRDDVEIPEIYNLLNFSRTISVVMKEELLKDFDKESPGAGTPEASNH